GGLILHPDYCCSVHSISSSCFFFTDPAPTQIYTLSLHDALPISARGAGDRRQREREPPRRRPDVFRPFGNRHHLARRGLLLRRPDRKSTRLNSSHVKISYAVFCLKKKKTYQARCS